LIVDPGHSVVIEPMPGKKVVETPEKYLVVLTISSYLFRLITMFHVNNDKHMAAYFTKADAGKKFEEVFFEMGNLCCGAMNRDLGRYIPHLGMSTPYMLESKCLPFLKELKPGYLSQHKITIDDAVTFHATLCLCAYGPLDFRVDMSAPEEETGALELF
jgi:hypothetical protein